VGSPAVSFFLGSEVGDGYAGHVAEMAEGGRAEVVERAGLL